MRNQTLEALVLGVEIEFGAGVSRGQAQRFFEAEECDFLWQARLGERWLGRYESACGEDVDDDEGQVELYRIAVLGSTGEAGSEDTWYMATIIIDGEREPHGIIANRAYAHRIEVEQT